MIEIKCDKSQKEALKSALLKSDFCIAPCDSCKDTSCSSCLDKNIIWVTDEKRGALRGR